MAFKALNLAVLLATALRASIPDTAQEARDKAQDDRAAQDAAAVRAQFDELTATVKRLADSDVDRDEIIAGITKELEGIATVLAGPADDPEDNGLISEVEQVVTEEATSPAVDAIVADAAETQEQEQGQSGAGAG